MTLRLRVLALGFASILSACNQNRAPQSDATEGAKWVATREELEQPQELPGNHYSMRADAHGNAWFGTGFLEGRVFSYDEKGKLWLRGRPGRGPGEFASIERLGFRGDTAWISDLGTDRITFFDSAGRVLGTVTPIGIVNSLGDSEKGALRTEAFLTDGSIWVQAWRNEIHWAGGGPPAIFYRMPRSKLGATGIAQGAERVDSTTFDRPTLDLPLPVDLPVGKSIRNMPQPWSDSDLSEFAPNGSLLVIVSREPAPAGKPTTFRLRIRDGMRVLLDSALPYTAVPIVDSMVDGAWKSARADLERMIKMWPSEMAARKAWVEKLYRPPHFPPVVSVLVGNDSTVWLEKPSASANALWEVYDIRGRALGHFELPRALNALTASGNIIWGRELTADGAWQMVRYRVSRQ